MKPTAAQPIPARETFSREELATICQEMREHSDALYTAQLREEDDKNPGYKATVNRYIGQRIGIQKTLNKIHDILRS